MKILELVIDDDAELFGIDAISLVEFPAIESDFVALKRHAQMTHFAKVDGDKRIVMGAALIPDKPIYRKDNEGEEYYVYFSKSTVRKAMELFLSYGNQTNMTLEHEHTIRGLSVVESWLVEDDKMDKSRKYGLDAPVGTWMVSIKVENEAIWNEYIKSGKVKGFSIEGFFVDRMEVEKREKMARYGVKKDKRKKSGYNVFESYTDYPEAVKNNAKRVMEYVEKNGWGSCGTPVGKKRTSTLAKGDPVSVDVIKRMKSYLERHAGDLEKSKSYDDGCGKLMYDAWGGKAGLRWATSKLKELELLSALEVELGLHALEQMLQTYLESRVVNEHQAIINDRLAYSTEEAAIKAAKDIGCDGFHTHDFQGKTWYMPCKEHNLAEVGPRGGVRPSKKAPKSDTPNKNPKGKGTAKGDASNTRSAKVSKKDEATLKQKSDDFNERYKEKLGYGVNVGMLKAVFQRGLGAFNVSHSPKIKSASAWAFARVNAFLYLVKNGRPQNKKYTGDNDLLPKKHPKSEKA